MFRLDFSTGNNAILGSGLSDQGKVLFFTANQGLVSVQPAEEAHEISQSTNESAFAPTHRLSESLNLSVNKAGGLENLTQSESKSDQLKAGFMLYCKRNLTQSTALVEEIFPSDVERSLDSSLDKLVVAMSKDLIDDFPASDPR